MEEIVLIPAYKPDEKLCRLVDELLALEVGIVIVNDGSPREHDSVFKAVSKHADIINLEKNCGKGAALKVGMEHIRKSHPECKHFVTADADGQHSARDIERVLKELRTGAGIVLTVRNLRGDIPKKSKLGNRISRIVYTTLTGHYLNDNQSGLRGFKFDNIDWMTRVSGEKYDYEMNVLYYADKQAFPITTMGIDTIYIDENSSSHFNPIKDTLRIYKLLFSSAWVTFASFLLTEMLVLAISATLGFYHVILTVASVGINIAFFSVLLNRFIAFRKFRYADGLRTVICTLCRFFAYGVMCQLIRYMLPFQWVSLILVFNLAVIGVVPLEYLLHKFMHKFKHREIIKE